MNFRSSLPLRFAMWGGLLISGWLLIAGDPTKTVRTEETKAVAALDRVPADTDVFVHVRVGDILQSPVGKEIVTGLGKQIEPLLKRFEEEFGFSLLNIDQFTLWQPRLADDGGQEAGFLFQTAKPYNADTLRKVWADPKAKADPKVDAIPTRGGFAVHLTDANTFAIMHKALVKDYLQPKPVKVKALENALKIAREKHAVVVGINFASLPAEFFNDGNVFLRPFFPLLKDNRGLIVLDVDKEVRGRIEINCKSADVATDALRSWNLLMQVASDGIDFLTKEGDKDLNFMNPYLKEVQAAIKASKAKTEGSDLHVSAAMKGGVAYSKLVAEIIKAIYGVSEAAQDAQSTNNLKQIGLALHSYHDANGGLPPQTICDKKGKPLLSWRVAILPYIEQENLYKQFKLDEPWDSEHNIKLAEVKVKVFMLPGEKVEKLTLTPYRCFFGNGAAFDRLKMTKLTDFRDGTSNTLMVAEAAESVVWTKPDDLEFSPKKDMKELLRLSRDRITVLYGDGSVRRLNKSVAESTIKLLIQKSDGQVIPQLD
jgi:hypothetical protein